jgi:hypothetical protein
MSRKRQKQKEEERQYFAEVFSFFPPLPHAWEVKAGLARRIAQAANFAGLLAWRRVSRQVELAEWRGLPAAAPGFSSRAKRRSDLRGNDSAVQSRVGDGMGTRLPEHEVRGEG